VTDHGESLSGVLARLLAPGERVGWTFRDRASLAQGFAEPLPPLEQVPPEVVAAAQVARDKLTGRVVRTVLAGLVVAALFGCCAGLGQVVRSSSLPLTFGALAVLMVVVTAGVAALIVVQQRSVVARPQRLAAQLRQAHAPAVVAWQARRAAFEADQLQRLAGVPQWGSAAPAGGARRLDVVGGNLWGWEALLTVFGASMLATHGPRLATTLRDIFKVPQPTDLNRTSFNS